MAFLRRAKAHNREQQAQQVQAWHDDQQTLPRQKNRLFGSGRRDASGVGFNKPVVAKHRPFAELKKLGVALNKNPDEGRILSLISSIERGCYSYYVKGGFMRGRGVMQTPVQVAQYHELDVDRCLFEIKDIRIDAAVEAAGLEIITAQTCRIKRKAKRFAQYVQQSSI